MRLQFLENHIRRDLEETIWDEEDREGGIVLRALEAQILYESEDSRICDICSIPFRRVVPI